MNYDFPYPTTQLRLPWQIALRSLVFMALVAAVGIGIGAQDKPATPAPARRAADRQLSDAAKFDILRAYKRAVATQSERDQKTAALCSADKACAEVQKRLVEEVNAYNTLVAKTVKDAGLPEGTGLQPNPDSLDVVVAPPPEKK